MPRELLHYFCDKPLRRITHNLPNPVAHKSMMMMIYTVQIIFMDTSQFSWAEPTTSLQQKMNCSSRVKISTVSKSVIQ